MVLSNYWKALNSLKLLTGGNGHAPTGMVMTNGSTLANILTYIGGGSDADVRSNRWRLRDSNISAVVGKGSGTISAEDYALFDDCTSSFSNFSVANAAGASTEGFSQVVTISGQNNSGEDITITEVGIVKTYERRETYPEGGGTVMFAKIQLDSPVLVPNNGTFQITVQWLER